SARSNAAYRFGVAAGLHGDLPITPSTDHSELRLRVGIRRFFGGTTGVGGSDVGDNVADPYAALAVIF
ncbi:MAG: hypothetical protein ABUS79_31750, partial [Pseudomonadota bacterium]